MEEGVVGVHHVGCVGPEVGRALGDELRVDDGPLSGRPGGRAAEGLVLGADVQRLVLRRPELRDAGGHPGVVDGGPAEQVVLGCAEGRVGLCGPVRLRAVGAGVGAQLRQGTGVIQDAPVVQVAEVEERLHRVDGGRVGRELARLVLGGDAEAEVDVLRPVVHPRLGVRGVSDVVVPGNLEVRELAVVVRTLDHQHVRGLALVEPEGRLVTLAGAPGHQVLEHPRVVRGLAVEEQIRFLEHREAGVRVLGKLSRGGHHAGCHQLLEQLRVDAGEAHLVALHRGREVDLATGLLRPVLAGGDVDVRDGRHGLRCVVDEGGLAPGLLLLVPVVVRHRRRALAGVLDAGVGAGVLGLRGLGDVQRVVLSLTLVRVAILRQVPGQADDVVQLLRLREVDGAAVAQDVVPGGEGDLLGHGGEGGLPVLHHLVGGQGLLVASHPEDVDVRGRVADGDADRAAGEVVGYQVVEHALDAAVQEDAHPVQALDAVDDVHGDMDALTLGPGRVLVVADAVVLRQEVDLLRQQADAVGVAVDRVGGADLQDGFVLVQDVVRPDVHLQGHAAAGGVPGAEVHERVVLEGELAPGRDVQGADCALRGVVDVLLDLHPSVGGEAESGPHGGDDLAGRGVDDGLRAGLRVGAGGRREDEVCAGGRVVRRLVADGEEHRLGQLVPVRVLDVHVGVDGLDG